MQEIDFEKEWMTMCEERERSEKSDGKDYRTEGQAGVIWWKADSGDRYE